MSDVFLAEDRAFKRLKSVALPFVDQSTAARRAALAEQEFRQNREISPDVYLGLADLCDGGDVVERLIVMRRLDPADELGRRVVASAADPDDLRAVARRIAAMHLDRPELHGADAYAATAEAVLANWEANVAALEPFVGSVVAGDLHKRIRERYRSWVACCGDLFGTRIDQGWVRVGHGDLRCEHVYCTPDGVRLIDCVAFDQDLRTSDVLADVAFLAMDLERLAGAGDAQTLMRAWGEFTGEHHPSSLAHFYVAYRAHVRAKVAALRHEQGDQTAAEEVMDYLRLAERHLDLAQVRLVIVGGGPGTGKSTVAGGVAARLGAAWLRADEVRKDLAGVSHDSHAFARPGEGIYNADMSERTIAELTRQAELLLRQGVTVVLDSTWRSDSARAAVRALADRTGVELIELRCELPHAIARERIAKRMASIHEPSDATPELVDYMADRFDAWPEAAGIDTRRPVSESVDRALDAILGCEEEAPPTVETAWRELRRLRDILLVVGGPLPTPLDG